MKSIKNIFAVLLGNRQRALGCLLALSGLTMISNAQTLKSMEVINLSNSVQELRLNFDKQVPDPKHFAMHQPAKIVLDFNKTSVDSSQRARTMNNGLLDNVENIKSQGKLRTILALKGEADYSVRNEGASVIVSIKPQSSALQDDTAWANSVPANNPDSGFSNKSVEFSRNSKGYGVVEISLQNNNAVVKTRNNKRSIDVSITNMQWSNEQERRLDVASFSTPVKDIAVQNTKGTASVRIAAQSDFEYSSYQTGNKFIVEVKPKRGQVSSGNSSDGSSDGGPKEYKGELLSLNFQDIEVRAVLQVIADFTGLNIVVSDEVNSRITVRLQNVPWDQALDVILKTKGLDSRQQGNIIYVAPLEILAQFDDKKPLTSATVQINYAKAEDIAKVLLDGRARGNDASAASAGLSNRGTVSVDPRTNNLLIQDTEEQLAIIRSLVRTLDQPVRQVQIDARIVVATDNFARELGVNWGVTGVGNVGDSTVGVTGTGSGASDMLTDTLGSVTLPDLGDRLGVNLGAAGATSGIGLAVLGSDFMVDLELSAMQSNSKGEVISSPRVLTADRKAAYIKQGQEVAYNKLDDSGNTTTEFKDVVLELNVTPQITPDNKIIMDLLITKDTLDGYAADGTPVVGTREVNTQALVADGETVVLGGVYEQISSETIRKVPFLADIPWVGNLFKNKQNTSDRAELLIFVTPHLVSSNLLQN